MDELAAVTVVSDLMKDVGVLRAERDELALEVSELKAREHANEVSSLSWRVFESTNPISTDPRDWSNFDLARVMHCLHMAWKSCTSNDLPQNVGLGIPFVSALRKNRRVDEPLSDILTIADAMNLALKEAMGF